MSTHAVFLCLLLAACGGDSTPVTDQVALQIIQTAQIPPAGGNIIWQAHQQAAQCSNDPEDLFPDCLWGPFRPLQQVTLIACQRGDWCFVSQWDRYEQQLTATACFWSSNGQVLRSDEAALNPATCTGSGTPAVLTYKDGHLVEPLSGAVLLLNQVVWP